MIVHENVRPALPMPIKATPYRHQVEAFNFVCGLFGLLPGGDRDGPSDGEMQPVREELPKSPPMRCASTISAARLMPVSGTLAV